MESFFLKEKQFSVSQEKYIFQKETVLFFLGKDHFSKGKGIFKKEKVVCFIKEMSVKCR